MTHNNRNGPILWQILTSIKVIPEQFFLALIAIEILTL